MNTEEETQQVYLAEYNWYVKSAEYTKALTRSEIHNLVHKYCKKFKQPEPQIVFDSYLGRSSSYRREDHIMSLATGWGQRTYVVLHELAHHLSSFDNHGPDYRRTMMHLVKLHFGEDAASSLGTCYVNSDLWIYND